MDIQPRTLNAEPLNLGMTKKESGYHYEIGGMSTCIEVPDLDALFALVKQVHQAHLDEGAKRVSIDLKVDDRGDKNATIQKKRNAVK